jgi:DNA-binding MarR family transcriptional regulator
VQSAHRLAKLIKKARRQMSNAIRGELEPIGVSLPVVQIIMRIGTGGDLSQLELAQELELEPAALSRLLADLEKQRLVTRRRDPEDKRRVLMAATPAGAALLTRAQPRVMAGLHALFARLSGREHDELCRLLEKVVREEDGPPARRTEAEDGGPSARAGVTPVVRRARPKA